MTNFLYNPDRKSKDQLIAEFVVRTHVFDEIMQDLEGSNMKTPEQHYLLVGQRGSGKTTLLNRIKYAVEDSEKLNKWLIPVIFSEEQYNISELANLWENVAQVLEDYHGFDNMTAQMEKHISSENFEEKAYDILEKELRKQKKKLVLLVDNVGDFLRKLDDKEVRRLREILQTKADIRLVAGSTFYLESVLDYSQPFFEFFKVMRLDGLSEPETQQLLRTLGEVHGEQEKINAIIEQKPERIETLRILTGGVPRTIALMFRIFIDYEHESSIRDLEKILDAVTPLYKHRMDDLPKQQQRIVDAVARNWDPVSVKDLRDRVRLDSKTISSQLRQLEKDQVIEKRETGTKNHLYLLTERFFNIWYLMRYGRKHDKQRVIWLVRFLESWCTDADIEKRVLAFVEEINNKKISDKNIDFFANVYSSLTTLTLRAKASLKSSVPKNIGEQIKLSDNEINELVTIAFEGEESFNVLKWLSQMSNIEGKNEELAIRSILKAVKNGKYIWARDVASDLLDSWAQGYDGHNLITKSQFKILVLASLITLNQMASIAKNHYEKFIDVFKFCLTLISDYSFFYEGNNYTNNLKVESGLFIYPLKVGYTNNLLDSIIDIFESQHLNHKIYQEVTGIFEPLYYSVLIIAKKMSYSQIPPEKEQLIRNIVERITSKD